jgi:hypothetical protein
MDRIRRAVEAVLPWYDPETEAERDHDVEKLVRRSKMLARSAGYGRVTTGRR